jgi:DNA-binding NarL/FixJ family response regulator
MALGTVAYMSPEQAMGDEVNHQTDIWSLGVTIYEMITGQLPFKRESEAAMVYAIQHDEPEPLTALRTGVPIELDRIASKCMRKRSAFRYQTVSDLVADLRHLQDSMNTRTTRYTSEKTTHSPHVPEKTIKALIADDHMVVREGLKQILSGTDDIVVAFETDNGGEALDEALKNDYDVVLLDISMPGGSGIEILKKLMVVKPELKVLILTMHPEEQYAIRALKEGASGYLTKNSAPDDLIRAIRRISKGGKYVSPELAEKLVTSFGVDFEKPPHELLSDDEREVLCLIASGKTASQIADELKLDVKNVKRHRARILDKMNMKTNAELIYYAVKNGLVD